MLTPLPFLCLVPRKMKIVVLKLALRDERDKQRAMRKVTGVFGVDSVSMDMRDMKMTVVGNVDPVKVASKLRKLFSTEVVSVGRPEKKEEEEEDSSEIEEEGKYENNVEVGVPCYYNNCTSPQANYSHDLQPMDYSYQYDAAHVAGIGNGPNSCVIC